MLKFYVKVFHVMGKALTGELSIPCVRSCFVCLLFLFGKIDMSEKTTVGDTGLWCKVSHNYLQCFYSSCFSEAFKEIQKYWLERRKLVVQRYDCFIDNSILLHSD